MSAYIGLSSDSEETCSAEVLCEAFIPTGSNPGGFKGLRDIIELAPGRLHIEIQIFHGWRK